MLNLKKQLVSNLETIGLPVYYELFCDSKTTKPCITYIERNNKDYKVGDTLGYSDIGYYIKLWGDDLNIMEPLVASIDDVTKDMGLKRVSYYELTVGSLICMVLDYEGLAREYY